MTKLVSRGSRAAAACGSSGGITMSSEYFSPSTSSEKKTARGSRPTAGAHSSTRSLSAGATPSARSTAQRSAPFLSWPLAATMRCDGLATRARGKPGARSTWRANGLIGGAPAGRTGGRGEARVAGVSAGV